MHNILNIWDLHTVSVPLASRDDILCSSPLSECCSVKPVLFLFLAQYALSMEIRQSLHLVCVYRGGGNRNLDFYFITYQPFNFKQNHSSPPQHPPIGSGHQEGL